MAALSNEEDAMEENRTPVACRSSRAVSAVVQHVVGQMDDLIHTFPSWSDEEKAAISKRFKEIYTGAFFENITVNGQLVTSDSQEEDTSEFEPLDTAKRDFINSTLLPEINDETVEVTKCRARYPRKCVLKLAEQCKYEHIYLNKLEYEAESRVPCSNEEEIAEHSYGIKQQAETVSQSVHGLMKSLPYMVENVKNIKMAQQMLMEMQSSHIDKAVYQNKDS